MLRLANKKVSSKIQDLCFYLLSKKNYDHTKDIKLEAVNFLSTDICTSDLEAKLLCKI